MSNLGDDEEEEEQFFESLDRILSLSCSSSSSSSSSDNDEERRAPFPAHAPSSSDAIPSMASVSMYQVWITEPASVEERRRRLLCQMGLSADKTLSRLKSHDCSSSSSSSREGGVMKGSISCCDCDDHLHLQQADGHSCISISSANSRSRSRSSSSKNHSSSSSSFPPEIHSIQSTSESDIAIASTPPHVYNTAHTRSRHSTNDNGLHKPPIGKLTKREIKPEPMNSALVVPTMADNNLDLDGIADSADDDPGQGRLCTIKNLDNGKEFVVNEFGEDGMWNKLREVGTGRQLTREEFELCVGHSPIVQELMRRQSVEESGRKKDDLDYVSGGSRSKKKGGWLKSIKTVASTVAAAGHRERQRRSSDERDTSSEKGGRRSSSATDDSQDVLFHMPQKTKVRQCGKSCKELTALYMSQEIRAHNGSIWTIKFSSDGCYLASAGEDRLIHIWQVMESKRHGQLFAEKLEDGNSNPFFAVSVNGSPEPALAENHFEKRRRKVSHCSKFMNLDHVQLPENIFALSEKPFCSFQGHLADVLDLSWSKSKFQHLLSSSMDKTVRLWDIFSNSCLKVFSHSDYVTCIQFNPVNDDYFISGSLDAKVRIWSIQDRQVVDWNDLHEMVTAACYTPDGQGALVGTHKGNCCLYNTSDNKLHQRSQIDLQNKKHKSHVKKVTGFQFAPGSSSEVIVTSADSRIRVVDGADLVHKFKGFRNTNSQISASLTANGKYVVCASEDSHVYVWRNDSNFRPSRSKGVTTTQSYEHFHCPDVSVAIPWPHINMGGVKETNSGEQTEVYTAADTQVLVDEANRQQGSPLAYGCTNGPLHSRISDSNGNYFSDRVSATWPEEKLLLTATDRHGLQNNNGNLASGRSAWGMVIVTAGLGGEIKTFQNFGLPIQI